MMIWVLPGSSYNNNERNVLVFQHCRVSLCYLKFDWLLEVFFNLMKFLETTVLQLNVPGLKNGVKRNAAHLECQV